MKQCSIQYIKKSQKILLFKFNKVEDDQYITVCILPIHVVDRHRFDAAPDPTFHFDSDPDLDWHQNNADPHADPIISFTQVGKLGIFFTLIQSNASLQDLLFFTRQWKIVNILGSILKFS
jgi:hypothetical protein